jgi:Flp pilus assembly protein TadD
MGDEFGRPQERMSPEEMAVLSLMSDEPKTLAELQKAMGRGAGKASAQKAVQALLAKGLVARSDAGKEPAFVRTQLLGSIEEELVEEGEGTPDDSGDDYHSIVSAAGKMLARERFAEASELLRKALKINPYDVSALCMLSRAQYGSGERDRAINTISKVLSKEPGNVLAWMTLARSALKAGDLDDAAECFRKVLELEPGNPDAKAGLGECGSRSD